MIKDLIADGKTEKAIQLLPNDANAILISSRFSNLEGDKRSGIISNENAGIELRRINNSILSHPYVILKEKLAYFKKEYAKLSGGARKFEILQDIQDTEAELAEYNMPNLVPVNSIPNSVPTKLEVLNDFKDLFFQEDDRFINLRLRATNLATRAGDYTAKKGNILSYDAEDTEKEAILEELTSLKKDFKLLQDKVEKKQAANFDELAMSLFTDKSLTNLTLVATELDNLKPGSTEYRDIVRKTNPEGYVRLALQLVRACQTI